MTNENICMLKLLSDALHECTSGETEISEWQNIYDELIAHCVHAIPANQIDKAKISPQQAAKYTQTVGRNIQIFYSILAEQKKVLNVLSGIDVVILKGTAAAMNYPQPEYRSMGDIDIIVKPDDFSSAYTMLCNAGYKAEQTPENYYRHIGFHSAQGIEIELHDHFSTSDNSEQSDILDEYIFNAIDRKENSELYGYEFPTLPILENGLVLLAHINQHIRTGIGLRQVIDWMCYVERYLDDDFWNTQFFDAAKKIGLEKLAVATTAMCKKYLGLDKDISWCKADSALCDELMEYVLDHGNFGHKNSTKSSTVPVLSAFKNPFVGLKKAQEKGCKNWKLLKSHPYLKPFAWIYQIFYWIKNAIKRGIRVSDVLESAKAEKSETDLLSRLGVTRM